MGVSETIDSSIFSSPLQVIPPNSIGKHFKLQSSFLSKDLPDDEFIKLTAISNPTGPLQDGQIIYSNCSLFKDLYIVQSGMVRTELISADGKRVVSGFFLKGDVLGLDAITSHYYPNTAIAAQDAELSKIPYSELLSLCARSSTLQKNLITQLGTLMRNEDYERRVVRNELAAKRVLHFLNKLYQRQKNHSTNPTQLTLPMSKQDIASYLCLTPETLSRCLKRLERKGFIINTSPKSIKLLCTEFKTVTLQ